jgi:hypothetical protein
MLSVRSRTNNLRDGRPTVFPVSLRLMLSRRAPLRRYSQSGCSLLPSSAWQQTARSRAYMGMAILPPGRLSRCAGELTWEVLLRLLRGVPHSDQSRSRLPRPCDTQPVISLVPAAEIGPPEVCVNHCLSPSSCDAAVRAIFEQVKAATGTKGKLLPK